MAARQSSMNEASADPVTSSELQPQFETGAAGNSSASSPIGIDHPGTSSLASAIATVAIEDIRPAEEDERVPSSVEETVKVAEASVEQAIERGVASPLAK